MCHAHDLPNCIAPSKTIYFVEATNLITTFKGGLASPPPSIASGTPITTPDQAAYRHRWREHFLMIDNHVERMNQPAYNSAVAERRLWLPNNTTGVQGFD